MSHNKKKKYFKVFIYDTFLSELHMQLRMIYMNVTYIVRKAFFANFISVNKPNGIEQTIIKLHKVATKFNFTNL